MLKLQAVLYIRLSLNIMKKIIFLNLFLLIHSVYSQQPTSFEFQGKYKVSEGARAIQGTYNSINKYVVVETKMSENEMYDKTINWLMSYPSWKSILRSLYCQTQNFYIKTAH